MQLAMLYVDPIVLKLKEQNSSVTILLYTGPFNKNALFNKLHPS